MLLLPKYYFKPSSSSSSNFLVSHLGHVSHVFINVTFAPLFFRCWDSSQPCLPLGHLLSELLCEPSLHGHCLYSEPKWPCQGHCPITSPKPCCAYCSRCCLSLPWNLGSWVPLLSPVSGDLSVQVQLSTGVRSWCSLPSHSPCMVIIQFKSSQACLILELPGAHGKISMFDMCPEVLF